MTKFLFKSQNIDQNIKARIDGKSWQKNAPVKLMDLCYVTLNHFDFKSEVRMGELIINKKILEDIEKIFKELFEIKFPIEKIQLIDDYDADDEASMTDNNSYAFCVREIRDTGRFSEHSYGTAIDLNPLINPCIIGDKIYPEAGKKYADRNLDIKGLINGSSKIVKIFKKYGWDWGGDWNSLKDYQHFEKNND